MELQREQFREEYKMKRVQLALKMREEESLHFSSDELEELLLGKG